MKMAIVIGTVVAAILIGLIVYKAHQCNSVPTQVEEITEGL